MLEELDAVRHEPLALWAAQQARAGGRVWTDRTAVAVASPALSGRDRLVLAGGTADVIALVRRILPEVGPAYRPVGDDALVTAVVAAVPELELTGRFGRMDVTAPFPGDTGGARWLGDDELGEVAELLDTHFPASYARPGGSGVHRWAGIRDTDGRLIAVAADAWSVPSIGFIAGVATRADARGRGLATAICAFVTNELLAGRERVMLLVDGDNQCAIRVYRRLGYVLRPVAAAVHRPPPA